MNIKQDRHLWTFWDYFLIGLGLLSVFIANIFIYDPNQGTVFVVTNFFYIPVISPAFQDPKRGIFVSSSLALLYFGVIQPLPLPLAKTAITSVNHAVLRLCRRRDSGIPPLQRFPRTGIWGTGASSTTPRQGSF